MTKSIVLRMVSLFMVFFMLMGMIVFDSSSRVSAANTTYYVDSVNGVDTNNGTSTSTAWRTLTKVNGTTFGQGDRILLKAGCSWTGQLWPLGSGVSGNPIVIDMYGTGNKPVIIGGTGIDDAVYLMDQQYWEFNNLEVTNNKSAGGIGRGIRIVTTDLGTVNHIYINNCIVHDIISNPYNKEYAGISFEVSTLSTVSTKFNDIRISDCELYDITAHAIRNSSPWSDDDVRGITGGKGPRNGWTNVIMQNNSIHNNRKPPVWRVSNGTIFQNNTIYNNGVAGDNVTGMYPFNSDDFIFQFNEVYGINIGGAADNGAFDFDYACNRTIAQYNYTHNNAKAFNVMRQYNVDAICRYNISQNDAVFMDHGFDNATGLRNMKVYNNIYYTSGYVANHILGRTDTQSCINTEFTNNIFFLAHSASWGFIGTGNTFSNNVYYGVSARAEDSNAITSNPMFVSPGSGGTGMGTVAGYKLREGSPCINSGVTIANNGGRDFWGTTLYSGAADRGACEYVSGGPTSTPAPTPTTTPTPTITPTPTPTPPSSLVRIDDTNASIVYSGTWNVESNASDYNGGVKFNGTAGTYAQYTFTGTGIKVGARKGTYSGIVDIYLDSVLVAANVDTYSSTAKYQQIIYQNASLALGSHTIKIAPTGTKNAASNSTSIRFDFFEYTN